jgi:26S proteasome regulatory subunit N10
VTPTNDIGKLLSALGKALIGGLSDLQTSIQVAQLALKHRENKNQRQRIVVFVGSPIEDTQDNLVKLGKKLRKNNVLIDVVTFGEEGNSNDGKLGALVEAAGGGESYVSIKCLCKRWTLVLTSSHLVSIPNSQALLSDMIASSPILFDGENAAAGGAVEGEGMFDGVDPNMDPELAMVSGLDLKAADRK